jgi:hypothetical protein
MSARRVDVGRTRQSTVTDFGPGFEAEANFFIRNVQVLTSLFPSNRIDFFHFTFYLIYLYIYQIFHSVESS